MFAEERTSQFDRLVLLRTGTEVESNTFAEDVRAGLTSDPKVLPPKYFYDKLGSHLFEAIGCLPEYYVTRDENEILDKYSIEIIDAIGLPPNRDVQLIELGSGSAEKTRQLIGPLLSRKTPLLYVPIDISESSLGRSSEQLLQLYPELKIKAFVGDYFAGLDALVSDTSDRETSHRIVLFLGSSIANLRPAESETLLRHVRRLLAPGDVLLLGVDLKKSPDVLLPAYDDALKVTAAFNLNLLVRINRELGGEFDIGRFEHRALYNEELSRVEMHLFSRVGQSVEIASLDLKITFAAGESIHTENSYKFDIKMLASLADRTGFSLAKTWYDSNRRFSLNIFAA